MKTSIHTLFFTALFLFPILIQSQSPMEYIISEHPYAHINKVIHAGGKTFLGGSIYSCNMATVFAFDENGEKEWEFSSDGYSWVHDMVFRVSDSILIIANFWATADDVGTMLDGPNIIGLDMEGNVVFEKHLSYYCCGGNRNSAPRIAINISNETIITNGDRVFWLNSFGDIIHSKTYLDYEFSKVEAYADSTLFFAHHNQIFITNDTGAIQNILEIGATVKDMEMDGENLLVLTADKISYYQIPTETLNSSSSFPFDAQGISLDNNWVYVWGKDPSTSEYQIQQHEKTSYDFVQTISLNQDRTTIKDVTSDEAQLYIVGSKSIKSDNSTFIINQSFIKTTPVFMAVTYDEPDISMSNFQVIEPAIISYFDSMEYIYYYENANMIFEYDLTNLGTDTIFSFTLSSQRFAGVNCAEGRHFKHFDNVMIPPNTTLTIKDSIDAFLTQYFDELHLTTFAPNHKFDGDLSNNYLLGLNFISTSVSSLHSLDFDLSIFPNPTSDVLNINFKNKDFSNQEKFKLVTVDGKTLVEENLIFGKNDYTIDIKNYPQGIYFFQYLENGHVAKVKKIVVQH